MSARALKHRSRWSVTLLTLTALGHACTAPAQTAAGYPPNNYITQQYQPRNGTQPIQRASYQVQEIAGDVDRPSAPGPELNAADGRLPPVDPPQAQATLQPSNVWTLQQSEEVAMRVNPVLQRAVARIDSARGAALQAALYPNPRWDTNNPQVIAGPASSYNVGFQQQVVVKGKLRLDKAAAEEVVRQRQYALALDRFAVLMAVRQQFYTVLAAQRRVEVLVEVVGIATAAVRAAEGRVQATEGTLSEVLLVTTEAQRAQILLQNAQTNLAADRRELSAIIGQPNLRIDRVAGDLTFGFPEYNVEAVREFVVSQNAQVQIARREIDRNEYRLRRARVETYPNLTVGPAYFNTLVQSPGSQQFWINFTFDIPIWDRNQGGIRSARADVADATMSLGTVQNDLLRQAEDAMGRYRAARQSEERIRTQILPTARRTAQLVRDGYQKGILDISTYLTAQRALTEAALNYVEAVQAVWTAAAEIADLLQADRFP